MEPGDGQSRDSYLKEHGVVTYLVINPKVRLMRAAEADGNGINSAVNLLIVKVRKFWRSKGSKYILSTPNYPVHHINPFEYS